MVMDPVPSYDDLIWLFEAEPVYRYEDDEREAGYEFDWRELWPYTAVTFHGPATTSRCTSSRGTRWSDSGCGPVLMVPSYLTWIYKVSRPSGLNVSMVANCYDWTSRTIRQHRRCGYG